MDLVLASLNFYPVLEFFPNFMRGVATTIVFSITTILIGAVFGFGMALLRMSRNKALSSIANFYISFVRGTPLLIQLYIFAYGIPTLFPSLNIGIYTSGVIALGLNSTAYVAEIYRSGIQAVDPGQMEAARSMGFSRSFAMRKIVFPQAFKNIIPAIGNEFVTVVKESSVVSILGIYDITRVSDLVKASTLKVFESLIIAALLYFIITTILTYFVNKIEKRLNVYALR